MNQLTSKAFQSTSKKYSKQKMKWVLEVFIRYLKDSEIVKIVCNTIARFKIKGVSDFFFMK